MSPPAALLGDVDVAGLVAQMWGPAFPTGQLVHAAAALVPAQDVRRRDSPHLVEIRQWEIRCGPGLVQIRTRDYAALERTAQRQAAARRTMVDVRVAIKCADPHCTSGPDCGHPPWQAPGPRGRKITEWSRKSRRELAAVIASLDLTPLARPDRLPGMLTLTYPGDWLAAAPSDRVVKRHLRTFKLRWEREWGPLPAIWKLEFQARGAPHLHLLLNVPTGRASTGESVREWVSQTWADVVDAPDPAERERHERAGTRIDHAAALRMADPKRVAEYFLKHGTGAAKEYQHQVPDEWLAGDGGTGRFWGVWRLRKVVATVPVTPNVGITAGRVLRRWYRAQIRAALHRPGEPGRRARRYRAALFQHNRGRLLVNDGATFCAQLANYLATVQGEPPTRPARRPDHGPPDPAPPHVAQTTERSDHHAHSSPPPRRPIGATTPPAG